MGTSEGVWGSICDFSYFGLHRGPLKEPRMQKSILWAGPVQGYHGEREKSFFSFLGRLWADPADSFRSEPQKTTSEGMSWSKVKNHVFPFSGSGPRL